jgi:outer membrane protein, heavy metal efflux system
MKFLAVVLPVLLVAVSFGQDPPDSQTLSLSALVQEAVANNPELQAWRHQSEAMQARVRTAGALDDPELVYMREQMPGFRWSEASMQQVELMQMIRFPTKLSGERTIAAMDAENARSDYAEKGSEIIARLRSAYAELWYAQQSRKLNRENAQFVEQFTTIARTRFGNGEAMLQDVLKANVELAKLNNQRDALRQQELSARAMLIALLNRPTSDTLGVAQLGDSVEVRGELDAWQARAMLTRPMILRDSLSLEQSRIMAGLSRQEHVPDFKIGLSYVTSPMDDFRGWTVTAGITLPFAPWTLAKASGRVDEADAGVRRSQSTLTATKAMVNSSITDLYSRVVSSQKQLESYRESILPQARTALKASLTAYQGGTTDFLMLIDAYRTLVELSMESLMLRMQFEKVSAELDRQAGTDSIVLPGIERSSQ